MSGGGGSTTTIQKTELPQWLQDAAKQNLERAEYVSKLGYVPQYGNDVAAFSPMQQNAFQNTSDAARAFGLQASANPNAYMPQATTDNLGFTGYNSGAMFDQYLANLQAQRPAQYGAMQDMFINPQTGDQNVLFTPVGSIASPDSSAGAQAAATINPESEWNGTKLEAFNFNQALQNLADAPAWVGLLPLIGQAKSMATQYVNDQSRNKANAFAHTERGMGDGNNYISSWGDSYNLAQNPYGGTRTADQIATVTAGLNAVANDPYSAASGQAHSNTGYWD